MPLARYGPSDRCFPNTECLHCEKVWSICLNVRAIHMPQRKPLWWYLEHFSMYLYMYVKYKCVSLSAMPRNSQPVTLGMDFKHDVLAFCTDAYTDVQFDSLQAE